MEQIDAFLAGLWARIRIQVALFGRFSAFFVHIRERKKDDKDKEECLKQIEQRWGFWLDRKMSRMPENPAEDYQEGYQLFGGPLICLKTKYWESTVAAAKR